MPGRQKNFSQMLISRFIAPRPMAVDFHASSSRNSEKNSRLDYRLTPNFSVPSITMSSNFSTSRRLTSRRDQYPELKRSSGGDTLPAGSFHPPNLFQP